MKHCPCNIWNITYVTFNILFACPCNKWMIEWSLCSCNASAHASLTPGVLQPSPYRNLVPRFEWPTIFHTKWDKPLIDNPPFPKLHHVHHDYSTSLCEIWSHGFELLFLYYLKSTLAFLHRLGLILAQYL
jgi:hypothetical protein